MPSVCERCNKPNADHARFCLHCGAMLEMQVADGGDPLVGKILLGRYRLVSVLGEGGMGKVYLAEQKMGTATRKVAIKTLHPELSSDPQLVARFHRESETVIELSHPNTIQFYDFGNLEDNTLFIVMEYIEGQSLAALLARGPVDPARADKLLIQICGSLHEAHQRGIVHRDLKPENVLLTDRGGQTDFVKVLDFGIAKRSEAEDERNAKLTKQGMVLGTPPYMSPEQFSGQALDARSDIYSLGVMTYEMLAGRLPFDAATPWEWATKHLTAQPKPIEATPAGAHLPPNKRAAILRSLAKNRDERQQGVLEFLQEFTGYQDAQAAWTMATSAGGIMPRTPNPQVQARAPIGTPGPMPQSGAMPVPGQAYGTGPFGPATPAPQASYASGSMDALPRSSGMGKIVAVLVIGLFILAGGAAGGLYWWTKHGGSSGTTLTQNPPLPPPVGPQPGVTPPVMQPNVPPPMVPSTPDPPVGNPPNPPDPPVVEPPVEPDPPVADPPTEGPDEGQDGPSRGPSEADLARARSALATGSSALSSNNLEAAISALATAQRAVGRRHALLRPLRGQIAAKGSNMVGIELQSGRCPGAQRLFRQLRSVGADGASRQHFGDWCPRP